MKKISYYLIDLLSIVIETHLQFFKIRYFSSLNSSLTVDEHLFEEKP